MQTQLDITFCALISFPAISACNDIELLYAVAALLTLVKAFPPKNVKQKTTNNLTP